MPGSVQERLKYALDLADVSAREIDRLAGLTPGHSSLIVSGDKTDPHGRTLGALAIVLGVSLDWLLLNRGTDPQIGEIQAAVRRARKDRKGTLAEIQGALGIERAPRRRTRPKRKARPKRSTPTPARPPVKTRPRRSAALEATPS
jgi:hypothetical protein